MYLVPDETGFSAATVLEQAVALASSSRPRCQLAISSFAIADAVGQPALGVALSLGTPVGSTATLPGDPHPQRRGSEADGRVPNRASPREQRPEDYPSSGRRPLADNPFRGRWRLLSS